MTFYHKYSLADLENLMPFEFDIYVQMVKEYLEAKEKAQQATPSPEPPVVLAVYDT